MSGPLPYGGELAGLGCALVWSLSAIAWSHAGRRVGSTVVATARLTLAAPALALVHAAVYGAPWPLDAAPRPMALMIASGVLGAGLGDLLFFRALKLLGPRVGMLFNCLAPAVAAMLARLPPLGERLNPWALAGMVLAMGGVAWVIEEEPSVRAWPTPPGHRAQGAAFALAGILCFAGGYVLSRMGMSGAGAAGLPPVSATLVRVASAGLFCWAVMPALGRFGPTVRVFRDGIAMRTIAWGTIAGPVLGIWLSLVALDLAPAGVASALIGTGPVFMLPLAHWSHGERPSRRAVFGTLVAVAGAVLLALRNDLPL